MDRKRREFCAVLLALKREEKKRWWVRTIFQKRRSRGASILIEEMRLSDTESYFNFFRMSSQLFDNLLSIVGPVIAKKDTNYRDSIQPKDRLALTLRYLATEDLMASLSYLFRIGRSTTSAIIKETCEAISSSLKPIVLAKPDQNKWLDIAEAYYEQWQFPNCLGAIDGKHVLIQAPPKSGSRFHNYKGTFSIILLACVDANYKFVLVDIGAEVHNSDGGVFRNSIFGQSLEKGTLQLPCPLEIPGTTNILPFLFIGDEAFPLKII
ncbi:DDE Tnp4 domain-containing protein [Trichonephila inaurata madagascariensis]|uniref:DDE Tnp4 domain-containing protein n=1 Tax=Trichonephila inaurata madagascariensis TaxID=2747483 RepID=A0A8X6X3W9_9ARAC|nr:DDE Tnp4 domain-containing protein [Trichonephila inaurata madagascariensis]